MYKNEIQKLDNDPVVVRLKKQGKFEIEKYTTCQINWLENTDSLQVKTIEQAIKHPAPSLATLRKYKGELQMKIVISSFIFDVVEFLNLGKSMNEKQVYKTAELIISEFYHLNLADFCLCFKNAIFGKYGALYDRLDGQVFLLWLQKYQEDRLKESVKIQLKKHEENKKGLTSEPVDKDRLQEIKIFTDKLFKNGVLKKKEKIRKEHGRIVDERTQEEKDEDRAKLEAEIKKYEQEIEQKTNEEMYINFKLKQNQL